MCVLQAVQSNLRLHPWWWLRHSKALLLPTVNAFNVAFQATNYTTIHHLHPEITELTKRIIHGFVKLESINPADITATPYADMDNQLTDDDFEVGQDTEVLAVTMSEDGQDREV